MFRKPGSPEFKKLSSSFNLSTASCLLLVSLFIIPGLLHAQSDSDYYPGRTGEWESRRPEEVGMNADALQKVVELVKANEFSGPRDLKIAISNSFEPDNTIVGPTKDRGGPAGMIIKNGYIIAEWGDTKRVDMTFSVTKSYLSTIAGLALDAGLIKDVHDKVGDYVWDGKFDSEHNSKITWHHLLNQSSDWSGTLFDKPDWADRPPREGTPEDWERRELKEPGTSFKYNDVRVNVLAYSLLQVWRRPLPVILKEKIMDPIGASSTWRWYGYENSWVVIDGMKMQSVSGGGHRGGGMFISTRDHARFGYLFLRNGKWKDKQLISEKWIRMLQVPSEAKSNYGYMWWLNNENIYSAVGFGGNYVVVDQEHDLVIVARWLESSKSNEFLMMVLDSVCDYGEPDVALAAGSGNAKGEAAKNHGDFVGVYEFELEGEKMVLRFTIKNGKLWAHTVTDDYEVGELTADKKQPNLFRGTTVHGEQWAFEFTKEAEGEPARCKFIDEDFGAESVGVRIQKD
ncbi:MAG: serine hydrolase domain-containing protein [Planctomycetota bacterium]|jgi:CubicO group peptidase (beta-lactamase class C family)